MSISAEEKVCYLREAAIVLAKEGFQLDEVHTDRLCILLDGAPLCEVTESGGIAYRNKDIDEPERIAAKDKVYEIVRNTAEYMHQMETAPVLKADGLEDGYKVLADFNGTVLAGVQSKHGVHFVTWDWAYGRAGVCHGHYFMENYLTEQEVLNMDSNYIIETKNLTKQYGSQKSVADLNIHVKRGRIYGLLGRNGAGKTTTMKMLLGLTKPTSGEVKIWGKSLQGNEKKLLPRIGSLIESPGFYPNLTGTENLRIFATLRGVPNNHAIKDALDLVGLPYKDKKLFSQYSLGMKQRLAIALAVMHDPELLILDEPINGLDPIGIAEVRSFIRELCDARGKTILISSHILSEISLLADDIGIIDHGALLEEESLAELEQKSSKHIRFTISDTAQAARILERNFHENHFSIQDDHNLRLHNLDLPVGKIVTAFVENGLEVSEVHTCEESLEDYFKRVTGGEGIA